MAVPTRPYYVVFNGKKFMVEAPSPAAAVRHIVGAAVTELRPARGSEVSAWHRANRTIEIAGAPRPPELPEAAEPVEFMADDAIDWLVEQGATATGLQRFGDMRREQRMTLEQFDAIRLDCASFGLAVAEAIAGEDTSIGVDDVRGHLEDQPIAFDVVIGAILDAKRRELFVQPGEPASEPHFPADGSEAEFR
jgi:hypothetical protein